RKYVLIHVQPVAQSRIVPVHVFPRAVQYPFAPPRLKRNGGEPVSQHGRPDARVIVIAPQPLDQITPPDQPARNQFRQAVSLRKSRGTEDSIVAAPEVRRDRSLRIRAA